MQFDGGRGLLKAILATKITDHIQIPFRISEFLQTFNS